MCVNKCFVEKREDDSAQCLRLLLFSVTEPDTTASPPTKAIFSRSQTHSELPDNLLIPFISQQRTSASAKFPPIIAPKFSVPYFIRMRRDAGRQEKKTAGARSLFLMSLAHLQDWNTDKDYFHVIGADGAPVAI